MSFKVKRPKIGASAPTGAADSGTGYTANTAQQAPNEATAKALKSDILAPRFYTTDFDKFDKMILDSQKDELEAILKEFRADYNKGHFVATEEFRQEFPDLPRAEFEEFLRRSCMGEFSGCLLYREISQKTSNPVLKEAFKMMTRDEGRHASFLTHTMKDLGIKFDLGFLASAKKRVMFPPNIIFYTVYLSEIIGYYRYIRIYNHLMANPDLCFHPIFRWFGPWCQDEHRHGHFFAALMRSQKKEMLDGLRNRLMIKFFTLTVYITMYLRDAAPGSQVFYRKMGLEPREYDLEVIKNCDDEASTVWGFKFQVYSPTFIRQLDKMAENNEKLKALENNKGLVATAKKLGLKANNVGRILRLFSMRTIKA
jgi:magnesium-protoporphyrin IX monomethyl ester (oxidative) cyclase